MDAAARVGQNPAAMSDPAQPPEFDVALRAALWAGPDGLGDSSFHDIPAEAALDLGPEEEDPALALRRTAGMFATGVTIITTRAGEQIHGMTANAFMSVSLAPPLILISVDRRTKMCGLLHEGSRYGVSVLASDQDALSDHFAGRAKPDAPEPRFALIHDTPLVEGALAHYVAAVQKSYWDGDHSLFLGRVEYAAHDAQARPLLFHGGRYEQLHRAPDAA